MKKIIFYTLLLLCILQTNAQNSNYSNKMKHIFGNINKTKVTTGYLKEFGIRFNEIEAYNGFIDPENFVDITQLESLHSSLYTMRIGNVASNLVTPNTVSNNLKTAQNNTEDILLAVQHYNYQQYKINAVNNGDVWISNGQINDVTGRNPYDTKTIFAVAPLKQEIQGNTFNFKVPINLIYTNVSLSINSIQIDFGNGQGYQNVTLNSVKSITYSSGGEKELKYKFTYSNGSNKYSHSKIWLNYVAPQNYQARFSGNINNTLYDEEPITGESYQGANATGLVTIELANGHTELTKPLIVVEGFDPNNSFGYFNFIFGREVGGINIDINSDPNIYYSLNQAIEDEGYDLVFINYTNGTDYIQRNALMVEKVIERVNNLKVGNEKNVVLGMSMGGLVARYALRNMELNGKTHETKLYISHDTPHQGANVPLGIQAFARHLYGEDISIPIFFSLIDFDLMSASSFMPGLNDGFELLESPAAKQMLIYQLNGDGNNLSYNNSMSQNFYNEYHTMGNPTQGGIRNIAVANGSECGNTLDFSNNETLINVDQKIDLPLWSNLVLGFLNAAAWNPLKTVSSLLSTNTDIKARFNIKALPNQESKQIYKGEIFISKTILGIFTVHEHLIDRLTLNSQSSMLPLDNASGGIYDIDNFISNLPADFNSYLLQRQFNFIPTYSSLNIGGGNQNIVYADLNKVYSPLSPPSGSKNVPFDNFYTNPLASQNHIQFTLENGNWLLEELRDNVGIYPCNFICGDIPNQINGDTYVCDNEIKTYTIDLPNCTNVSNWSVSPNLNVISQNYNSITVSHNSVNPLNSGFISINVPALNFDLTKGVIVGSPKINSNGGSHLNVQKIGNVNLYAQQWSILKANYITLLFDTEVPYTYSFEWSIPNSQVRSYGNSSEYKEIKPNSSGQLNVGVRVRNECGCSNWNYFPFDAIYENTGGGGPIDLIKQF
jgi:hypothetical protein